MHKTKTKNSNLILLFGFVLGVIISAINVLIANNNLQINVQFLEFFGSTSVFASLERFYVGIALLSFSLIILISISKQLQMLNVSYSLAIT